MQKEDYNSIKTLEDILEKDLQKEMAKINTAGTINPTEVENLSEAVCLMLKLKEYEQWLQGENNEMDMSYTQSYRNQPRNPNNGQYMSYDYNPYSWGHMMPPQSYNQMPYGNYSNNTSNHSTKDRMISRLEDMMGDAKNEYEAKMIRDAITYIQSN